jgi:glycosyltransferase involved in cell wall biosynthesis
MTDGTVSSESKLGPLHRFLRSWVYRRSQAFVAAADAGLQIYRSYGCGEEHLFRSALCADNGAFAVHQASAKRFDLLFCGRLVDIKNPLFALRVARLAALDLARKVSVCFVGSGPLESEIRAAAAAMPELEVSLAGFAAREDLPGRYAEARIFLLPSLWDPWGVVANEACAAGLPVICSPHAGVAGELVRDGENGFVRELDARRWADAAVQLLRDAKQYAAMSAAARRIACDDYNFAAAADGLVAAVRHGRESMTRGMGPAARPGINDARRRAGRTAGNQ